MPRMLCRPSPLPACRDGKPRVRWAHFFDVEPVGWSEGGRGRPTIHLHSAVLQSPALQAYLARSELGRCLGC